MFARSRRWYPPNGNPSYALLVTMSDMRTHAIVCDNQETVVDLFHALNTALQAR